MRYRIAIGPGAGQRTLTLRDPTLAQPAEPRERTIAPTYFLEAYPSEIASIEFGDEGQYWKLMGIDEYLCHKEGVPNLQRRLRDYLEDSD